MGHNLQVDHDCIEPSVVVGRAVRPARHDRNVGKVEAEHQAFGELEEFVPASHVAR